MASRSARARMLPLRSLMVGDGAYAAVDGANEAVLARLLGHLLHEAADALVGLVVVVDDLPRLLARDADALREAERLDGVGDGEVDDLGEAALLLQLFLRLRAEDEAGRALVYVLVLLEGVEHLLVVRDVREQTQLKLRVVGRDEDVPLLRRRRRGGCAARARCGSGCSASSVRRRETPRRRHRLIELRVDAPVRADQRGQRVGVGRLELVQLAVLDDAGAAARTARPARPARRGSSRPAPSRSCGSC